MTCVSVLLSLLASALWGAADYAGGAVTRRLPVGQVVLVTQTFGLGGAVVIWLSTGGHALGPSAGWGVAAGLTGVVALAAFYTALATGTMGVVAPVAATGVVVPVIVGLVGGEQPHLDQVAGILLAIVGVVLASGLELRRSGAGRARPLLLAGVSAIGFGLVITFITHGSRINVGATLVSQRLVAVLVLGAVLVGRRIRRGEPVQVCWRDLPLLAGIGLGDVGANTCLAFASTRGLVAVVAVLSSLYPVVTVMLAWRFQHERMRGLQVLGVVGALAGVCLLAAG